ncbi:MAG: PilZ domain-containing protein [Candidatus Hydrogenedentes bacterium]|nr:PilZ domain-containing protein [Candidatus Hydrogenedentota bacterium]
MPQAIHPQHHGEQRRFARVTCELPVKFRHASTEVSTAETADIGRGGLCLHSGLYYRPGTRLVVRLASDGFEVNADVAWCRPSRETAGFWMGLRIVYDEAAVWNAMTSLLHRGLETSGAFSGSLSALGIGSEGAAWTCTGTSTERAEALCAQHSS